MRPSDTIGQLRRKYLLLRSAETFLFAVGTGIAMVSLCLLFTGLMTGLISGIIAGIMVAIARLQHLQLNRIDLLRIASFLDRKYADLHDSADLLVLARPLSDLEMIQRHRVDTQLEQVIHRVKLPHHILFASLVFTVSVLLWAAINLYQTPKESRHLITESGIEPASSLPLPVDLKDIQIDISPPSYTHLASQSQTTPEIECITGSKISWTVAFSQEIKKASLRFTDQSQLELSHSGKGFTVNRYFENTVLYQIEWISDHGDTTTSDYFQITALPDHPPHIEIKGLPQFTRLEWSEPHHLSFETIVQDDFGLQAMDIIATVSKGSGESVKFREEKFSFDKLKKHDGRRWVGSKDIDLNSLGMSPGDELYFYAEAYDNRLPAPQRSRTETFFVALQDTARENTVLDAGLGVDIMPDYFRSQRQIIIDTEHLLARKSKLAKPEFNATSNELGYDQKVLRLKYGEFLGEEFETSTGPSVDAEIDAEHIVEAFGHQHDTENEHHLVKDEEKSTPQSMPGADHDHDDGEEATFFSQSIRAKLRAALSLMWDSELQLRLYEPKKSLPYQYKILKLLKEISEESRVYVHRMGFDPPPIKEDRRLTGDLAEIRPPNTSTDWQEKEAYSSFEIAVPLIVKALERDSLFVDPALANALRTAAQELISLSMNKPGAYLKELSVVKSVMDDHGTREELANDLGWLKNSFFKIIPSRTTSPSRGDMGMDPFNASLMKAYKSLSHE